jgi:hypothetical protein
MRHTKFNERHQQIIHLMLLKDEEIKVSALRMLAESGGEVQQTAHLQ